MQLPHSSLPSVNQNAGDEILFSPSREESTWNASITLARILEGPQQPGALTQSLVPGTTCRDVACYVSTLRQAFNALPATQQDQIRNRWGYHLNEIFSLSRETDPELFYEALFHLTQRLEREGRVEQAGLMYGALLTPQAESIGALTLRHIQEQSQERLKVLNGGGGIGHQLEHMGRGFAQHALDPGLLLGASGMGLLGKGVELMGMRGLAGAGFFHRSYGLARTALGFAPKAGGFVVEATAFPFAVNGANELLGRAVSWDQMDHQIYGSYFFLGGMRVGGRLGASASRQIGVSGLQVAGSIGGIMLGHGAEVYFDLKEWHGFSNFIVEAIGTWTNIYVAGRYSDYVFGGHISRMHRAMELSIKERRENNKVGIRERIRSWLNSLDDFDNSPWVTTTPSNNIFMTTPSDPPGGRGRGGKKVAGLVGVSRNDLARKVVNEPLVEYMVYVGGRRKKAEDFRLDFSKGDIYHLYENPSSNLKDVNRLEIAPVVPPGAKSLGTFEPGSHENGLIIKGFVSSFERNGQPTLFTFGHIDGKEIKIISYPVTRPLLPALAMRLAARGAPPSPSLKNLQDKLQAIEEKRQAYEISLIKAAENAWCRIQLDFELHFSPAIMGALETDISRLAAEVRDYLNHPLQPVRRRAHEIFAALLSQMSPQSQQLLAPPLNRQVLTLGPFASEDLDFSHSSIHNIGIRPFDIKINRSNDGRFFISNEDIHDPAIYFMIERNGQWVAPSPVAPYDFRRYFTPGDRIRIQNEEDSLILSTRQGKSPVNLMVTIEGEKTDALEAFKARIRTESSALFAEAMGESSVEELGQMNAAYGLILKEAGDELYHSYFLNAKNVISHVTSLGGRSDLVAETREMIEGRWNLDPLTIKWLPNVTRALRSGEIDDAMFIIGRIPNLLDRMKALAYLATMAGNHRELSPTPPFKLSFADRIEEPTPKVSPAAANQAALAETFHRFYVRSVGAMKSIKKQIMTDLSSRKDISGEEIQNLVIIMTYRALIQRMLGQSAESERTFQEAKVFVENVSMFLQRIISAKSLDLSRYNSELNKIDRLRTALLAIIEKIQREGLVGGDYLEERYDFKGRIDAGEFPAIGNASHPEITMNELAYLMKELAYFLNTAQKMGKLELFVKPISTTRDGDR